MGEEADGLVLDVGCGDHPRGTVNCDLNLGHTLQGSDQTKTGIVINPHAIPNFVRCEATHLPFRGGVFDRALSFHLIEHLPYPPALLRELFRVSRGEVEIRCPHRLSHNARKPHHLHYFDHQTFTQILRSLGVGEFYYNHSYLDRSPLRRLGRILPAFQIMLPEEIQVIVHPRKV